MSKYSALLQKSVESIIDIKEQADILSLFTPGGTTITKDSFKGLDDFELITMLIVY